MDTKEAGEALGQMLKEISVLKELDVSGNHWTGGGPAFAKGIAGGLGTKSTIITLDISNTGICWDGEQEGIKALAEAIKGNVSSLQFFWYHFELDLTSGSTAVVYGYSYYN